MTLILHPLIINNKIVPNHFECVGTKETIFVESILLNGEKIYSHQSGYGFLRASAVVIDQAKQS